MVLDKYRAASDRALSPIAKRLPRTQPNTLSWLAFTCAVLGAVALSLSLKYSVILLIVASVLITINGFLDLLDGLIAKMFNKATKRGDFLDHVLDRYADIIIVVGIIVSGYCNFYIGLFGLIGVFLTSYMGTQSQAVGVKRDYGGLLGRADRLVLMILMPLLLYVHIQFFDGPLLPIISDYWPAWAAPGLTLFDILMLWFGIAGNLTALQRAVRTWKDLSKGQ
jgi:archaetidylinositol phosphate synthase